MSGVFKYNHRQQKEKMMIFSINYECSKAFGQRLILSKGSNYSGWSEFRASTAFRRCQCWAMNKNRYVDFRSGTLN